MNYQPTRKQLQKTCCDFLRSNCKGETLDAPTASTKMNVAWGVIVDWHEFVIAFETLQRAGEATLTQGWGHCKYEIK